MTLSRGLEPRPCAHALCRHPVFFDAAALVLVGPLRPCAVRPGTGTRRHTTGNENKLPHLYYSLYLYMAIYFYSRSCAALCRGRGGRRKDERAQRAQGRQHQRKQDVGTRHEHKALAQDLGSMSFLLSRLEKLEVAAKRDDWRSKDFIEYHLVVTKLLQLTGGR